MTPTQSILAAFAVICVALACVPIARAIKTARIARQRMRLLTELHRFGPIMDGGELIEFTRLSPDEVAAHMAELVKLGMVLHEPSATDPVWRCHFKITMAGRAMAHQALLALCLLLSGCTVGQVLGNIAIGVFALLAMIGALVLLSIRINVTHTNVNGESTWSVNDPNQAERPGPDVVLAKVVTWACAVQRDGTAITGDDVLRVIAEARKGAAVAGALLAICLLPGCGESTGYILLAFGAIVLPTCTSLLFQRRDMSRVRAIETKHAELETRTAELERKAALAVDRDQAISRAHDTVSRQVTDHEVRLTFGAIQTARRLAKLEGGTGETPLSDEDLEKAFSSKETLVHR